MKQFLTIFALLFSLGSSAQILLNSDINVAAQRSVDGKQYRVVSGKHVPYDNAAQFLAAIPSTRRHVGEIAYIFNGSRIEQWHFVGGIADSNFVAVAFPSYLRYPLIPLSDSTAGLQGDSMQLYTTGSTLTVGDRVDVVAINPATVQASLVITLPDTASYKNEVQFFFGGTITIGQSVITSISFAAPSGQTILQPSQDTPITSGSSFTFKFIPALSRWVLKSINKVNPPS